MKVVSVVGARPQFIKAAVGVDLFAYGDGRAGSIIADVPVGLYMDS
jgi:UDP-N-acetylglucosamine 2-epimerase